MARSTTLDLAEGLRGVPIPFAGKLSRIPSRALYCNGATPLRADYPELFEVLYSEENTCDVVDASPIVTMDDTSDISVGDSVEGFGVLGGSVVVNSIDSSTQITLSDNLKSTATNVTLRFFPWGNGDGFTTFDLPDLRGAFLRGTGSHGSETKASGGAFAGPNLGKSENDQFQGHWHRRYYEIGITGASGTALVDRDNQTSNLFDGDRGQVRQPISDSVNGSPRTGDETRPFNVGVNYIIFY